MVLLIDVFVSNGYSEGLQVSPMEAMASGCYCLSHQWDGAEGLLLPLANLFIRRTRMNERILRYAHFLEAEKQRTQARMRDLVCERFNVDVTKVQIRHIIEGAALSVGVA